MTWAPVFFGAGVLAYFSLNNEPSSLISWFAFFVSAALGLGAWALTHGTVKGWAYWAILAGSVALTSAGFAAGALRTQAAAAPVLRSPIGPVAFEGWVERDDVGPRLRKIVIKTAWVEGMTKADMPHRIQIAAPARPGVSPGRYVNCFGNLTPPPAPVTPGGYDFARSAYFNRIGATGFTLRACEPATPPRARATIERIASWLAAERRSITTHVLEKTQGASAAGFVAALATGDESAIAQDDIKAMQNSGLAHLLAVSGMNMTLVGGFAFFLVRALLSVMGNLPLYVPIRAVAAAAALAACAAYWALTGSGAATGRAFVMAAVAFGAIIIGRPAISMRSLAIAALLLLAFTPESLMSPGFQMSFAATMALVAAFEAYNDHRAKAGPDGEFKWVHAAPRAIFTAALTSFVAGAATSPYGAYHFQTYANYGFVANLAATPLIGLVVIPSSIAALLLTPLGLTEIPLASAEWGSQRILDIAHWISSRPNAVSAIPAFHPIWLLCATFGLIGACLLRGWIRALCIPFFGIAAIGAALSPKTEILISADAKTIFARTPAGIARSPGNEESFEQTRFRQAMGIPAQQPLPTIYEAALPQGNGYVLRLRNGGLFVMQNSPALKCPTARQRVIILMTSPEMPKNASCPSVLIIDSSALQNQEGSAIIATKGGYRLETVAQRRGARPWTDSD